MNDKNRSLIENKLYNYKYLKKELNSYLMDLEYLENNKDYGYKGRAYTGIKTSPTNNFYSPVENELVDIEKKIELLKLKIREKKLEINLIEEMLILLEDKEIELIKYRYFSNGIKPPTWYMVGKRIGVSENTCLRMRNKIIKKITRMFQAI